MSIEERLDEFCHEARQSEERRQDAERMKAINEEKLDELLERWEILKIPKNKDESYVVRITKFFPDLAPELRRRIRALRRMEILGFPISPP